MRRRLCLVGLLISRRGSAFAPVRVRHFINLTNGLEALEALDAAALANVGFVRIQSSHCEAGAFYSVLENLDHNLLFHLATGATCVVYDLGSRESLWPSLEDHQSLGAEKIPRALWWGLEWSRYALARLWRLEDVKRPLLRGYDTTALFNQKFTRIPKPLYKRLKYYRKFEPTRVDLRGVYRPGGTSYDGDDQAYAAMVRRWCDSLPSGSDESLVLPPGFLEYRPTDYAAIGRAAARP